MRRPHEPPYRCKCRSAGFDDLLAKADTDNKANANQKAHAHLPGTISEALPYLRALIVRHHTAMLEGNAEEVTQLRNDAENLACKLSNYEPGILADENAPGCVLARLTRAEEGTAPLGGQAGSFEIQHWQMRVRIEIEGLYGIGGRYMSWAGFSAHAVELDRPFLSETGYRSFLGAGGPLRAGYTPEGFVTVIIAAMLSAS